MRPYYFSTFTRPKKRLGRSNTSLEVMSSQCSRVKVSMAPSFVLGCIRQRYRLRTFSQNDNIRAEMFTISNIEVSKLYDFYLLLALLGINLVKILVFITMVGLIRLSRYFSYKVKRFWPWPFFPRTRLSWTSIIVCWRPWTFGHSTHFIYDIF